MAMQGLKTVTQLDKAIKETTKTTPYSIAGYAGLFLSVEVSKHTGKRPLFLSTATATLF